MAITVKFDIQHNNNEAWKDKFQGAGSNQKKNKCNIMCNGVRIARKYFRIRINKNIHS